MGRLRPIEIARLVTHVLAIAWPIFFLIFQPSAYSIVSDLIIHIWMPMAALGGVGAALGVITRIDLKLELPSLYLLIVGPLIYWVAQIGFIMSGDFENRIALSVFVLWHISLLVPRIVELEARKRNEQLKARGRGR